MDIVIYTTPETLSHKKGEDGLGPVYYWSMKKVPKKFKVDDKIYFVTKGYVRGSFKCISFNPGQPETIEWNMDSWEDSKDLIKIKAFRGFRYRWW